MTEKILIYHQLFIGCLCVTVVCFLISLFVCIHFKLYKMFPIWLQKGIKKKQWKRKQKKEERNEQTKRMSKVKTRNLAIHRGPGDHDDIHWM